MSLDWLKAAAPAIATALGAPHAGAAADFIAGKLDAYDSTLESIKQALSGMTRDRLVKL